MSTQLTRPGAPVRWILALTVAISAWIGGCQGDVPMPGPGDDGPISFSERIQPIFTANCTVCHRPGGIAHLQGIELALLEGESHAGLVNQRSVQDPDLTIVVPGDSGSSLLFLKVSSNSPPVGERMPFGGPRLAQSDIDLIRDWIDQGAPNN